MRWRRREVEGDWTEAICIALLTEDPCSFVVITEGEEPEEPGERYCLLVPPWGEA